MGRRSAAETRSVLFRVVPCYVLGNSVANPRQTPVPLNRFDNSRAPLGFDKSAFLPLHYEVEVNSARTSILAWCLVIKEIPLKEYVAVVRVSQNERRSEIHVALCGHPCCHVILSVGFQDDASVHTPLCLMQQT